jgi:hypothetical protein
MTSIPAIPLTPPQDLGKLRNQVLDTLLFTMCAIGLPAFGLAQWRAQDLGWGLREALQLAVYAALLWATWSRHRISQRFKANILVLLFLSIGVAGEITLGVFAGGIFFLPIPLFIAAQFHSIRTTLLVGAVVLFIPALTAVGFSVLGWTLPVVAEALLRSPLNWGVYVLCFCVLVIFTGVSIRRYRDVVERLLGEVSEHRDALLNRNRELEQALAEIRTLQGILPICSWCHQIRDDAGAWKQLEHYISTHSEAQFSHGICPSCVSKGVI